MRYRRSASIFGKLPFVDMSLVFEEEIVDIDAEKVELRRRARARRDALTTQARAWKSSRICEALVQEILEASSGTGSVRPPHPTVAVYAAFGSEADPAAFALAAERAGWRVAYPCMLTHSEVAASGQLMCMRAVHWNARAAAPFLAHPTCAYTLPAGDADRFLAVPASKLDAIVVPLVAFDENGNRLGYGGGCYDRYLPTLRPDCQVIGIAFDEQRFEQIPTGPFDLPLPRIISA